MSQAIEQLIAHRAPFRYVDELVEVTARRGRFLLRLAPGDPRLSRGVLPPLFMVEALAQSTAAFWGASQTGTRETGMLVSVDSARFAGSPRAGELVNLTVELTRTLGPLVRFSGVASVHNSELAQVELTVRRGSESIGSDA